jgi:hypothetical protein
MVIAFKVRVKSKNLISLKHALLLQTPHNIYLFMASYYAIYIVESEPIKASEGEGAEVGERSD